jgi:hypothetical protein
MIAEDTRERFDTAHGTPFDRGSADSWYSRPFNPHYGGVGGDSGSRVELVDMTADEIVAYTAGYNWNEQYGGKKSWD